MSASAVEVIGLCAALFPAAWMGIFSREAAVVGVGVEYLRHVAPFYGFFGLGMGLYFASQGAGHMAWPFSAGVARLGTVLVAGAGWHAVGGTLASLFWIAAASQVLFGAVNAYGFMLLTADTRSVANRLRSVVIARMPR
jgi:Na+-driven multidrug efflux pump